MGSVPLRSMLAQFLCQDSRKAPSLRKVLREKVHRSHGSVEGWLRVDRAVLIGCQVSAHAHAPRRLPLGQNIHTHHFLKAYGPLLIRLCAARASISSGCNSSRSRRSVAPSSASRMPASGAPSARWREQDGYGRGCVLALAPSRRLYLVREWAARGECCDAREGRVQDRAQGFAREECLMPRHDHVRE